jgi:hypothetical protein
MRQGCGVRRWILLVGYSRTGLHIRRPDPQPWQIRVTVRTILLTSTGSREPLRFVTHICARTEAGGVRRKPAAAQFRMA